MIKKNLSSFIEKIKRAIWFIYIYKLISFIEIRIINFWNFYFIVSFTRKKNKRDKI